MISGGKVKWGKVNSIERKLTVSDLEKAKQNIEAHFLVAGVTEMFEESLFLIKQNFNLDNIFYIKKNSTKTRPKKDDLSKETLEIIKENNQLDIKLYNFVKQNLKEKIDSLDPEYKSKLNEFCSNKNKHRFNISDFDTCKSYFNLNFIRYLLQNSKSKKKEKVIIFGASNGGIETYKLIRECKNKLKCNIQVKCFLDNDRNKWRNRTCSKKISKPNLKKLKEVDKIIIASEWGTEIRKQILNMNLNNNKIMFAY
jgi:hypothetical protein